MNLQNFDRFLVACQDRGIIDSATYTESADKVTYKLISGARTVLLHVKEGQALLQSVGKDKLECIKSNNLDRVLPRIISQALFPAQNFKTLFGIYQGVFIAPIAKHRITSSAMGVDPTNGEIYQDNFLFVNDNGNITVYVKYADDWNLLRSFETRAEAVLFCDKLSWNLTKASEMKESADMAAEMGESSEVEENVPVEETLDEEAMLNDVSEDLEAYALPEEIEAFEEDPSIETLPVAEDIEFMTSSGKRFIVSHDESQVTMGFYNLLKDAQGEEAMMLLPTLVAPNNVRIKVGSSASIMKDILSSYSLLPKNASVPKDSLVQVSQNFVLSKADFKNVFKANRILKSSFSDSLDAAIGTTFGASIPDKEVENVVDDALNMGVTSFCDKYVKTGKNYKDVKDFWDAVNLESSAKKFLRNMLEDTKHILQSSASRRSIKSAAGDEDDLGVDFGNPPKGETTTPEEFAADEPPADDEGFDDIETTTDEDLFNDEPAPFIPDAGFSEDELSPTEEEIVTDIHEILESHDEGAITDANAVAAIGQDLIQLGLETVNASEIATQIAAEEASIDEEDAGFLGSDVIESSAKKVPIKSSLPISILKDFKYAKNPKTGKYFQFDYETGTYTEVDDINEATIVNGSFYPQGYELVNYKGLPIESSAKRKIQSKKILSDSQIEDIVNMVAQNLDKNILSADQVRSLLHSVNDTEEQAQEMVVEMSDLDPFTKSEVIQMLNSSARIHQNFAVVDQNDTLIDFFPTQEEADSCLETFKAQNPGVRAKVIENKAKRIKSSFVLLDTKNQNRVISSPYEDEATAQQDAEALNSGDAGRYVVKALGQEA